MLGVDAATWARLSPLLDEALDLPPEARTAWLDGLPPAQADLRDRLAALLDPDAARLSSAPRAIDDLDDAGPRAGDRVGPYRLVRPLGTGGMGVVWLAERADGMLARRVALKLPRADGPPATLAARMARERAILAGLAHPNIARLYDAGLADGGQPYLAMEVVEGERIDRWCRAHRLPVYARLALFLQAARAVAHAHAQLVVHRDLKPSNLLVGQDGQVKLLDFGIAKLLDPGTGEPDLTQRGMPVMTPAYASPEQVGGLPVGTHSDVYALGVLLYELLTDRLPYRPHRDTRAALEEAVLSEAPARPSDAVDDPARRRLLRGDLDAIVLQALRKQPAARYATVDAFIEDIERHLRHEPVRARHESWAYPLRKFVRRHRLGVAAAASIVGALVVGLGAAWWQADRAEAQRLRAEQVRGFLTALLRDASPYTGGDVGQLSAVDLMRQAQQRLQASDIAVPEVRVELGTLIGESLVSLGDYAQADAVFAGAVKEGQARLGRDHPLTLAARINAAQVLRLTGHPDAHRAALDEMMPAVRALGDREPALLAQAQLNLAMNAVDRGDFTAAVAAARESFSHARQRLGDRHEDTVASAIMLALTLVYARQAEAAEQQAALALKLAEARYPGPGLHPRRTEARLVHGRALALRGDLRTGVAQIRQAAAENAQLFGPDAPALALVRQNLVGILVDLGELEAAEREAREALRVIRRVTSPGAYIQAGTAATLGQVLLERGRAAEALEVLDAALQDLLRTVGPKAEFAVVTTAWRARALVQLGRLKDAEAQLRELPESMPTPPVLALRVARARAAVAGARGDRTALEAAWSPWADHDAPGHDDSRAQRERAALRAEVGLALAAMDADAARPLLDAAAAELARLHSGRTPLAEAVDRARRP